MKEKLSIKHRGNAVYCCVECDGIRFEKRIDRHILKMPPERAEEELLPICEELKSQVRELALYKHYSMPAPVQAAWQGWWAIKAMLKWLVGR